MSRTPAAEAARLKIQHPRWTVERDTEGGWRATSALREPGQLGRLSIGVAAPSVAVLETLIVSFDDARSNARTGARAAGARVP